MTWVEVTSFDGLGQPQDDGAVGRDVVDGLVPLALLLLGGRCSSRRWVRRWQLRLSGGARRRDERGDGLPGDRPVGDSATSRCGPLGLADVPVADLVGTQRHYWGRGHHVGRRGRCTLVGAVLLLRSPVKDASATEKYAAPARRREAARQRAIPGARHVRTDDLGCPRRGPRSDRSGQRGAVTVVCALAATLREGDRGDRPDACVKGIDGS